MDDTPRQQAIRVGQDDSIPIEIEDRHAATRPNNPDQFRNRPFRPRRVGKGRDGERHIERRVCEGQRPPVPRAQLDRLA